MHHFVIFKNGPITSAIFVMRPMPTEEFTFPKTWSLPETYEIIAVIHDIPVVHGSPALSYTLRNEVIDALPR